MTKREFLDTVFALAPNEANKIMDAFDEYVDSNKIDCDKMDKCEKLQLQPVNSSEIPNNSDAISRQAAIDALRTMQTYKLFAGDDMLLIDQAGAQTELMLLPPIQPKRGRWISADAIFGGVPFYCSECGENTRDTVMGEPRWNFCPNCGADMREVTT